MVQGAWSPVILVGPGDVPALVVLGFLSAFLFQRRLRRQSLYWYSLLTGLIIGIFWLNVIAANVGLVSYWGVGTPTVSLDEIVGVPYVLAYPLWFRAVGEIAFLLFGRQSDQGGLLWVFRLADRTESIDPSWRTNDETTESDETDTRV